MFEAREQARRQGSSPGPGRGSANGAPTRLAELPTGMKDNEARALYDAFVAAKRSAGENTDKITYPALVRKLARELPKLQAKHGGGVRFEVATVDGKVKLRARGK